MSGPDPIPPGRISVIIPTLQEERGLSAVLERMPDGFHEVIVADGGSDDHTRAVARAHGCRVVLSTPGRGVQMNAGAARARGDVLLFLHADTVLPPDAVGRIHGALADTGQVGGGFRLAIDSDEPFLKLVSAATNLRARLTRVCYGDQAVFVRREVFERIGGFPELPLMEDVAFGRRLKSHGGVALVDTAVHTSARRWERGNPLWVTFRNRVLVLLFMLGVSPQRLARWYR
ncbi:MAG: TIGR04283 family arsenosugar biosynthesis glycosyltransferase [Leptospirillia bacterium]